MHKVGLEVRALAWQPRLRAAATSKSFRILFASRLVRISTFYPVSLSLFLQEISARASCLQKRLREEKVPAESRAASVNNFRVLALNCEERDQSLPYLVFFLALSDGFLFPSASVYLCTPFPFSLLYFFLNLSSPTPHVSRHFASVRAADARAQDSWLCR